MGPIGERFPVLGAGVAPMFGADTAIHCGHCGRPDRVRYRQKFLVQLVAAAMFPLAGLYINDFYGLLGIHYVSSFIGVPLTLLLVVFITNAVNLIDGIEWSGIGAEHGGAVGLRDIGCH